MKKILFISNIPAPYRIDFYNELGKCFDLTVLFEAKGASDQGIKFNYNLESIKNFHAVFLSEGNIREKRINWKIIKFLKTNKFDEIVVTSYSYFTEMVGIIYLKLMRQPYYMETDGGMIRYNENKIKRMYKCFLISGAKGYFSPSDSSDDYLIYYGAIKEQIYRYPFTSIKEREIISEPIYKQSKQKYKMQIGAKMPYMILGIGQFIHRKGWDILLQAANEIKKPCDIYIIGGETSKEYLDLCEKLNIKNVHFLKFMSKERLKIYYRAADIFVLPTREDIWGLVINEALSYGLPTITTNMCVAGNELIESGKNGYIFPVNDYHSLAKYCNILFEDNLMEYSINALHRIREYTIENMVTAHKIIWEGV